MKLTRAEKIWLAAVIIFYACYNLPFVPAYGHAKATLIHGLITLIPLWISVYIGLVKICRIYRLRDPQAQKSSPGAETPPETDTKTSLSSQTTAGEITKEDTSC
ncbi:MAG: hypothetical protein LIO80_01625 [Lachnospiraceae bacterium]|nr:hypothetical protein [Lachnospiraceae bacterium]